SRKPGKLQRNGRSLRGLEIVRRKSRAINRPPLRGSSAMNANPVRGGLFIERDSEQPFLKPRRGDLPSCFRIPATKLLIAAEIARMQLTYRIEAKILILLLCGPARSA